MNAPTPDQRKAFQASREAIASAETNEQIVARLRRDCEVEKHIRSQAVLNETLDAGGSMHDAWDAAVAEMNRIDCEYGALIGKYRPRVVTHDRPDEYHAYADQVRGDYVAMQGVGL